MDEVEKINGLKKFKFERCRPLCEKGTMGDSIWYILEGEVAVLGEDSSGESKFLMNLSRGQFVGEEVVFLGRYQFTALTLSEVTLVKFTPDAFMKLLARELSFVRGVGVKLMDKFLRVSSDLLRTERALIDSQKDLERVQVGMADRDSVIRRQAVEIRSLDEFLMSLMATTEPRAGSVHRIEEK
jgi:CRP-like cAMP-binding protein